MASCDRAHRELDHLANGSVQLGPLPEWTRVKGKAAWIVLRGSYSQLPGAWSSFPQRAAERLGGPPGGPAGDVYVCSPMEHAGAAESGMLTILYVPA